MAKCAFLGLGVMGAPMAGHLVSAGHEVTVWNRTGAVADDWAANHDGRAAVTVSGAVSGADFVLMCVGRDEDALAVAKPAIASMMSGGLLVDHTTTSADCARTIHGWAQDAGIGFLDAPISGGQAGAESGQLTVMCGGSQHDYDRAVKIMDAYAKRMTLIGPVGTGQMAKMMNQICIAGTVQGLSEAIAFGQAAGLDIPAVIEAIGGGAAQSWQMDNRALTMARDEFEFGFAVDWMRKDLGYAIAAAESLGVETPIAKLVDSYYGEVQRMGGGRWDTSSLLRRYKPTD